MIGTIYIYIYGAYRGDIWVYEGDMSRVYGGDMPGYTGGYA